MPYITAERKKQFDEIVNTIAWNIPTDVTPGDLNYLMTMLARYYIGAVGKNYQSMNDVLGVFDAASKEFYRRVAAPYEDKKIEQNGDVY